jgi:hypothetical protein
MIAILAALAAMAMSQDIVSDDPVPGMLPNGVGKEEGAIPAITDVAVKKCVQFFERELAPQAGMRIDRSAMTFSRDLGQIWRADAVSIDRPLRASRYVCTKASKSIEPLDSEVVE